MGLAALIISFTAFTGLASGLLGGVRGVALLAVCLAAGLGGRFLWLEAGGADGVLGLYLSLIYAVPVLTVLLLLSGLLGATLRVAIRRLAARQPISPFS